MNIDIVFPYVDCRDKVWQKAHQDYCASHGLSTYIDPNRFRSWDLLRYLFRGIEVNTPYIRKVHLIVSNIEQVPSWLDQTKVHIVLHKDIIPEKYLPTFSSSCIEMFIGNIKGLAKNFVYINDDVFFLNKIKESEFFSPEGYPKINLRTVYLRDNRSLFTEFVLREYRIIADYFGRLPDDPEEFRRPPHGPIPKLTDDVHAVQKIFKKDIDESITPFRTETDMTQYIYDYYSDFMGHRVDGGIKQSYFGNENKLDTVLKQINSDKIQSICINDANWPNFKESGDAIRYAFYKKFPNKSKFELNDGPKPKKPEEKREITYYLYF